MVVAVAAAPSYDKDIGNLHSQNAADKYNFKTGSHLTRGEVSDSESSNAIGNWKNDRSQNTAGEYAFDFKNGDTSPGESQVARSPTGHLGERGKGRVVRGRGRSERMGEE